jgi:hypothetical protein
MDVALIHYPLCTDSIKPCLQFLCNFVVINASEGSLCFQIFTCHIWKTTCFYSFMLLSYIIYLIFFFFNFTYWIIDTQRVILIYALTAHTCVTSVTNVTKVMVFNIFQKEYLTSECNHGVPKNNNNKDQQGKGNDSKTILIM